MGHQDQDGEKVGPMLLFDWKLEAATDIENQKFIHFQVLLSPLSPWSIKNKNVDQKNFEKVAQNDPPNGG